MVVRPAPAETRAGGVHPGVVYRRGGRREDMVVEPGRFEHGGDVYEGTFVSVVRRVYFVCADLADECYG